MFPIQGQMLKSSKTSLFLCDFHGRDMSVIDSPDVQYVVESILQSKHCILTDDFEDVIKYLSKQDLVFVIGGSVDVDMLCNIDKFQHAFERLLKKTLGTNLIVALLALTSDNPYFNEKIVDINRMIISQYRQCSHCVIVNFYNLSHCCYDGDGFHLNAKGKAMIRNEINEVSNNLIGFRILKEPLCTIYRTGHCYENIVNREPNRYWANFDLGRNVRELKADPFRIIIIDRENKDEQVKELEKKLKEKEELEKRVQKDIEGLEEDMMCSICAEIYIEPTALSCGHMFCSMCIKEWNKKKKICPMCRAKITTTIRIFNMDSVIERNVRLMPEEARTHREALIADRKNGKTPQKQRPPKKRRRETQPQPSTGVETNYRLTVHEPIVPALPARQQDNLIPDFYELGLNRLIGLEGDDDPFRMGWVNHRNHRPARMNSPVDVAAVDLTTVPVDYYEPRRSRARTHTVTSADANSTIDLTNI